MSTPPPPSHAIIDMMKKESGTLVADRSQFFKTFEKVMRGSDIVAWFLEQEWCDSSSEAIKIGTRLIAEGFIYHIVKEPSLKNDKGQFYRFKDQEGYKPVASERNVYDFDIVVIGAGSGGITGALFAADLHARVMLVEKTAVGGDCTWTGCVPSKSLIKAANAAYNVRNAAKYGTHATVDKVDMKKVREYVDGRIQEIYKHETPEALAAKGVIVQMGAAKFVGPHEIEISDPQSGEVIRSVTSDHFVIATGARPRVPAEFASVPHLTYETIFANEELPESMAVVGSGPIGSELGQAYARLGAGVRLICSRVMPKEPKDVQEVMHRQFESDGMEIVKGRVTAATEEKGGEGGGSKIVLTVTNGEGATEVRVDRVLVCTGRVPNVEGLGLDSVGVRFSPRGIEVDKNLRTSVRHILAAGDVTGGAQFTHYAGWQAFQAVRNCLMPGKSVGVTDLVPWVTFTVPEVGSVGLNEEAARAKHGNKMTVLRWNNEKNDRAVTDNDVDGFMQLQILSDGKILGATVVMARAGEVLSELVVAMRHGLKVQDLAEVIHPYPTYSFALMQLAAQYATVKFLESGMGKFMSKSKDKRMGAVVGEDRRGSAVDDLPANMAETMAKVDQMHVGAKEEEGGGGAETS